MNEIVLGSFFGDEGKGQVVHNLCKSHPLKQTIVVRFSGGHQVGHTVRHGKLEHTFSNFGCGTLLGVPTYWSQYCTVDPITSIKELQDLNKLGIHPEIIYNPLCEVVIPFDVITQWNDKKNLKHGSVGTGFKAALDRVAAGYHITVVDCLNPLVLREKIIAILDNYYNLDGYDIMLNVNDWCLQASGYFNSVNIKSETYLNQFTFKVFEGSQGILLDQKFGIMPYCTPSNTTCQNAVEIINKLEKEETRNIFVIRPYITRHGNGPIPSMKDVIEVNDPNNKFNEFQKTMRCIKFDSKLLEHVVIVNSIYRVPGSSNMLYLTHSDETNDSFFKDFDLSMFNRVYKSFYDSSIFYDTKSL